MTGSLLTRLAATRASMTPEMRAARDARWWRRQARDLVRAAKRPLYAETVSKVERALQVGAPAHIVQTWLETSA